MLLSVQGALACTLLEILLAIYGVATGNQLLAIKELALAILGWGNVASSVAWSSARVHATCYPKPGLLAQVL